MSGNVSPVAAGIVVVIVLAIVVWFGFRTFGPRTDGPSHPINMGAMMGKSGGAGPGAAPYKKAP